MLYSVPANLIRQWSYCPRVVYYMELANIPVCRPSWVRQGEVFHSVEEKLWGRRNLSRFHLKSGKAHYKPRLRDRELGLHGVADMAIETSQAVYAVEFKLSGSSGKKRGDQLQLAAYSMLLEKRFAKPAPVGFLTGGGKAVHVVNIDEGRRRSVLEAADKIRKMLKKGLKPDSSAAAAQCSACEYINFCNDRL